MEGSSFLAHTARFARSLEHMNFLWNTCINGTFSDKSILFKVVEKNCDKIAEVKPICDVIEECRLGEKCCRLSKFNSVSRFERKKLEHEGVDEEVSIIFYDNNPKVEYLLVEVYKKFPNITVYDASNCAVRQIFFDNFELLFYLESINLANNQISTFVEFAMLNNRMPLKYLDLCNFIFISTFPKFLIFAFLAANNRIKFSASSQFLKFSSSLETVDLTSNVCIDGKFEAKAEIQKMALSIDSKCSYELHKSNGKELFCDQILRCEFDTCCYFGADTVADSPDYKIVSRDFSRIQRLSFGNRENRAITRIETIQFLPTANRFTKNLIQYTVEETAVKIIDKDNFHGMIWLESLRLSGNLIETIQKDTFQGLVSLNEIILGKRSF